MAKKTDKLVVTNYDNFKNAEFFKKQYLQAQEMIKEFMNKVCTISLFNESFGVQGKIVAVEDNWIKVEEKNGNRMINGDMIRDIKLMPEKYQK